MTLRHELRTETIHHLTLDPILRRIERELPAGQDLESWSFVRRINHEYQARGGDVNFHAGAPAEAIRIMRRKKG